MRANGLYSSSVGLSSLKGRTSNRFSGMVSSLLACLVVCVRLLRSFFLDWDVDGGLYSAAMDTSLALSWPLSSYRFKRKLISFLVWSREEQSLWARHSSPLKVAIMVRGFWQDWGLIVIFVAAFTVHAGRDGAVILAGKMDI